MDKRVAIIGYGSMGGMIANKLLEHGVLPADRLFVANRTAAKLDTFKAKYPTVHICSNADAAAGADVIFLCVRTGDMKAVFEGIRPVLSPDKHVVSLNGSLGLEHIAKVFDGKVSIVIPAVTAEVDMSQTLVCHNDRVTDADRTALAEILASFGAVIELPASEMGIGSELVSCMPGFLAKIVDVFAESALAHTSIPKEQIIRMVFDTMQGTAELAVEQGVAPEALVARVATPGGITEEGVKVLAGDLPAVTDEIFRKTMAKRTVTSEAAVKTFEAQVKQTNTESEVKA